MRMNSLPEKLYFLGLSGMGMAPLALFLADRGHQIEGVDDHFRQDVLEVLNRSGVRIRNHPGDEVEMMVVSRAIEEDHELVQWARSRSIPVLTRGEALCRAVSKDSLIAVVGSHGKTTTTAFLIHLLEKSGVAFDYVLGGLFADSRTAPGRGATGGKGKPVWVVAEVDESDGTIEHFSPELTLAVDWSWDHPDHYHNAELFDRMFFSLFERTRKGVWISNDQWKPLPKEGFEVHGWGDQEADLPIDFPMYGECNRRNAVAARSIVETVAGEWNSAWWEGFPGVLRRQQRLGETLHWEVYQDYAHHPDELNGLFAALHEKGFEQEPVILFQPHRYSRTKQFLEGFAQALSGWQKVALMPVYGAGEDCRQGVDSDALRECFPAKNAPALLKTGPELETFMESLTLPGAGKRAVWFVGAGDIEAKALSWMRRLQAKERWDRDTSPFSLPVHQGELLAGKTTLRVGGAARYYAEPESREELLQLLEEARQAGIPVYPLGRGSNLLVMDRGVEGLVVRLRKGSWEEIEFLDTGQVRVGAGVPLKKLCGQASGQGMEGFEFLEGIPGSLGGALRMNAGAMGGWMLDVVDEVEILTNEGHLRRYPRNELHASYRCCQEVAQGIALTAILSPRGHAESDTIRDRISTYSERRKETQPREPSAGCIFKNPEGSHAGKLVDQCGLKGVRVGDAEISRVHGNFIINRGNASSKEVLALINLARKRVYAETGYRLEPEVLLWGAEWKEVLI